MSADKGKSSGQLLVEGIEKWLTSYLVFPSPGMGLIAALWALNTWWFEVFDATPYLSITAATKRAGKTTLLDLLSFISRNPEKGGAGTAASLFRLMEMYDGKCSLFFDESERLSSSAVGMMRTFMNFGYRKGESIPRTMPGGKVMKFPCYGPKAFALIGDPEETLRDRSILFVMRRGVGARPYRPTTASAEAVGIVRQIGAYVKSGALADMAVIPPDWTENRDQEIWEPLWSLVVAMKCDAAFIDRFQAASADLISGKGADRRHYSESGDTEAQLEVETYGEKAIRDLWSVMNKPDRAKGVSGDIWSHTAVERMKAITTAPWRNYKGEGLTQGKLADLLKPFGIKSRPVREGMGRAAKQLNGYSRADVLASLPADVVRAE